MKDVGNKQFKILRKDELLDKAIPVAGREGP
jgi:hypothetical protein